MAVIDKAPKCSICGQPMDKLTRLGDKKETAIFACSSGLSGKNPCDGLAASLGLRFG